MRQLAAVLFGLVLACPLVTVPGAGFDSFRLPAVLILAAALLGCAFVRSSRGGDRPPGPAPLRMAGFLLLGAEGLSLAAARSLADSVPPILILSAGLAVFSCMKGGLLRREKAAALLPVISGTAALVAGIGIVQVAIHQEGVATEGNRNYAGALAAMLLPPAVAFTRRGRPWERLLSGVAAVGLIVLLLASESRGGFLGALAGLGLAAGALRSGKVGRGLLTAGTAILVLVAAFVAGQGRNQISERRLGAALFRIETWKAGLRMIAKRPLLGWGAGSFQTEYPPFRTEAEFQISHSDGKDGFKEVEDPHSTWVATAVETGIPGLLALVLVVYVAARLWRYYVRRAADPESAAALAGLGGGALAYLVAGSFNTLTLHVSHTLLFWSFLGLMEVVGDLREWRAGSRSRETRVAIPAAAAVALLFGAFWTGRMGAAEQAFTEGMRTPDPSLREAQLREAIDLYPPFARAHFELAATLKAEGRAAAAVEQGRETLRLRPYHVEALNLTALSILGSKGDPYDADRLLREAIGIAPYYYKSYYNLALIEGGRGHLGEMRCLLGKSIDHKPDHGGSYYHRGLAFLIDGDPAAAVPEFRMAKGLAFDVAGALDADRPSARSDPRLAEFFK
ncbi:MAG TPA: O-antigen ligase family protein [Planctomycetota bacterium]|nr:O-antigen ligase family protein [Planctomycetota bacterium]